MEIFSPEVVGLSAQKLERVRACWQSYVDRHELPGAVTLIARYGKVAFFEKFGVANIETNTPMQLDSLFGIYSMTKPVTAAAIMMLLEQGFIHLEDPVSYYIPVFKNAKVLGANFLQRTRPVTIYNLLTHTGGLSYGFTWEPIDLIYKKSIFGDLATNPNMTLEILIDRIAHLPLACQPGTRYRYSLSFDVLGYIVQVISGLPFDVFLKRHIFEPLGMVDTDFWVPPEKVNRLARIYEADSQGKLKPYSGFMYLPYDRPPKCPLGGGGLVSTASDYFRFAQMLLNYGELDGVRLLSRKAVELMTANHLPENDHPLGYEIHGLGFGLTTQLQLDRMKTLGTIGSFGGSGGASTAFWIDPQYKLVAVTMIQYMGSSFAKLGQDFRNLIYQTLDE